jgi:putative endonuclease
MKTYAVYILTNATRMLYVGVTNDLDRRIWEHKNKVIRGFAARYRIDSLVYFESFANIKAAIAREKQLKGWLRAKKVALIHSANPSWTDLAATHFHRPRNPSQFPTQPAPNSIGTNRPTGPSIPHQQNLCHPERSEGSHAGGKRR